MDDPNALGVCYLVSRACVRGSEPWLTRCCMAYEALKASTSNA